MSNILRIDASARHMGSTTRQLTDRLVARLVEHGYGASVTRRDLTATPPALLTEAWVAANFTDAAERSTDQRAALAASDELITELETANTIVIGVPVYNFGIPASLKAWIDLIARARKTFRYTENGSEGLLTGKKAFLVVASGGVQAGSEQDFATSYLRHVLAFVGITDVSVIAADQHMMDEGALTRAASAIEELPKAA
ncbi:MAG: NAD(P)H-dependent oxidoreductase [Sphingopyxis sp.]|uniref:FMN-dependent NADH-azoreductase n=1 Tax=Sphingopyxis sp. TaxID=1908224 RepID=UPI002AB8676B|nr:NAD(P)H-dependent oxidoreductase [Sphingopyxis sp.]MDZ3830397.1 NAD(P)H-dependent oxidoreductase [Sphingopyxis sp.]